MSEEKALAVPAEVVDTETGEVLPVPEEFKGYAGVATIQLNEQERETLAEVLPAEEHDILPTGEVYVPQVHYRRRLNKVFGPGSWALVPRGQYVTQGKTLCREYALIARGCFISESTGEADYHEKNERMTYASAAEAVKSNAVMRCCKDLGIGWECWDPRFCETFKREHCIQVWRRETKKPQWRRKDAPRFWDERGPVEGPETQEEEKEAPPSEGAVSPCCQSEVRTSRDGAAFCGKCRKGI